MTATPYVAIDWTPNQLIDEATMDQIMNNVQWLFENKPNARWSWYSGISRNEGVKVLAGSVIIPAVAAADTFVPVSFGSFFSSGCNPIITITPVNSVTTRNFFSIQSFTGGGAPDNTGFIVNVGAYPGNNLSALAFIVNWIAIGY